MTRLDIRRSLGQFAGLIGVVGALLVVGDHLAHGPAIARLPGVITQDNRSPYLIASPLVAGWRCDAELSMILDDRHLNEADRADLRMIVTDVLATLNTHSPYRLTLVGTVTHTPHRSGLDAHLAAGDADVHVGVIPAGTTDMLSSGVSGTGGFHHVNYQAIAGWAVLDVEVYLRIDPSTRYTLILHELLHALGLAHSADPLSVLYPHPSPGFRTVGPHETADLTALNAMVCERRP